MNVLRERIRRTLMNAAIDGKGPGIMTPEETKTFESMYAEIQRNRAEGHSYEDRIHRTIIFFNSAIHNAHCPDFKFFCPEFAGDIICKTFVVSGW